MEHKAKILVLLLLAAAVPATAQTFGLSIGTAMPESCLSIGNAIYRVGGATGRDNVTVRIDPAAETPDIRIQLADSPDTADFVFVDDGETPPSCRGPVSMFRNVKIDAAARRPDLTLGFASSATPADYRIFVRSRWLSPETAAAIFAAARVPARMLAGRASDAR